MKSFLDLSYSCLTDLFAGIPDLNKAGGGVKSALVDCTANSFSKFPVLPCCTFKIMLHHQINLISVVAPTVNIAHNKHKKKVSPTSIRFFLKLSPLVVPS